jgi:hypothetical protein
MLLATIAGLLSAYTVDGKAAFGLVGSAFSVASAMKEGIKRPIEAYVIPLPSGFGQATQDLGPLLQQCRYEFGVVVGLRLVDDPKGEKGPALMDQTTKNITACLLGRTPTPDADRIEITRAEPIGIKENTLWMLYRFKTMVRVHQE